MCVLLCSHKLQVCNTYPPLYLLLALIKTFCVVSNPQQHQGLFEAASQNPLHDLPRFTISCCDDEHRVNPPIGAKEATKLMAWGLGADWQGANARALISNVVCGIRRGMAVASSGSSAKVGSSPMTVCGYAYDF